MKQLLAFLVVVGIAGVGVYYFFPGLFVEVPTELMAERAVTSRVAEQSKDVGIELFKKTDGQERTDDAGVRRYSMDSQCVAKFKKNTMWSFGAKGFETTDPLPDDASRKEKKKAEYRLRGKRLAKAGETVVMKGTVEFENKESGWVVSNVTLKLDR